MVAGQHVLLGPTTHLPRPENYLESHHSFSRHAVCSSFGLRFFKKAVLPMCFPRSGFTVTPVAFCPEDAFLDLTANSILGVIVLSIAFKIAL